MAFKAGTTGNCGLIIQIPNWLPWRGGTVQYPQYPGGVTAAVISQSKLFIFYHVIFYSFQPHSCAQE